MAGSSNAARRMLPSPHRCADARIRFRSAVGGLVGIAAVAFGLPGAAGAAGAPVTIAILPLTPVDTGMPYAVLPTASQLAVMSRNFRSAVATAPRATIVPAATVARALARAGFDQDSALRACVTPDCAQRIGRLVGAGRVFMGGVTREMGVVWSTDASVVDVPTGKVLAELRAGYKGDVNSMIAGETRLGSCLVRATDGAMPCKDDPGY